MEKYYKLIAQNKRAFHDYNLMEKYTAGISLTGAEVKSVRMGRVNLKESFGRVENGAVYIYQMHITPYAKGRFSDTASKDATRPRKLLLNKAELRKIIGSVSQKGMTLVPIKMFFSGDWAKLEIALARAKKKHEKRESIKRKETQREVERVLKEKGK